MSWDEIRKTYPGMWVVLKDTEKDGPNIMFAVVIDAKTDDEIVQYEDENLDKGYEYWRTTEGEFYGIIDSNIEISIN
jgi:hypothetical protein